jgi:cobalt-zinc-cadmium efflux system protein
MSAHVHVHAGTPDRRRPFAIAFALTLGILAVEVAGGLAANSLALLSDAGHVITDVFALGLGWFAASQALRPATGRNTWGFHRIGIVAALINAAMLVLIALFITLEAVGRLRHPEQVSPPIMIAAATLGIAVNLLIALLLSGEGRDRRADLNVRAALLHVLGDVGASAGVVAGAIVIAVTGVVAVDAVLSVGIAVVLALGALRVGRAAMSVLLEAAPADVDIAAVKHDICAVPGVCEVHHVHLWSLTNSLRVLSCHAVIDDDMAISRSAPILTQITDLLRDRYAIDHATVQFEERSTGAQCECSADPAAPTAVGTGAARERE